MSAGEVPATVAAVALPEVAVDQSKSNFIAAVRTSAIDAKNKLVGFQGDFTFDERVVTFAERAGAESRAHRRQLERVGERSAGSGTDQDAAHIGLLERLHAAVRVGNAVRTEDDQGEQGSSRHAIALGGATGPVHLHRRRSQHAEAWQRSAWQRHSMLILYEARSAVCEVRALNHTYRQNINYRKTKGKAMKLFVAAISLALSVMTNAEEAKSIKYTT